MNKILFVLLVFVFVFATDKEGFAQHRFSLNGKISLDSLTKYVHKNSGVRFSFNSTKVKGSKEIVFSKGKYSMERILQRIKETTSLYYSFYAGYVIFQDNPPKKAKQEAIKQNIAKAKPLPEKNGNPKRPKADTKIQQTEKKGTRQNQSLIKTDTSKTDTAGSADTNPLVPVSTIDNTVQRRDSVKVIVPEGKSLPSTSDTSNSSTVNTTITAPSKNKRPRKPLNLHFGIQWNINLPVHGFGNYFTGTNSKSQAYNFLIPGIWISKSIGANNNELLLLVKPEQEYFTGKKLITTFNSQLSPPLDTTSIQKNTFIIKTKGIYAGLQYNYQINSKWVIGGGINFHWQYEALAQEQTTRLANGALLSDSLFGAKKSSALWQFVKPYFVSTRLEAIYKVKKLNIGAAVFIPVTSVFAKPVSATHPLNAHLFLRWRLK